MEILRNVATSLTSVIIVYSILFFLLPEAKIKKTVKSTVAVSLILTVLLTFLYFYKSNSFSLPDFEVQSEGINTKVSERINRIYLKTAENTVKEVITNELKNNNIEYEKIEIIANNSEDGGIYISKVMIYCDAVFLEKSRSLAEALMPDCEVVSYEG